MDNKVERLKEAVIGYEKRGRGVLRRRRQHAAAEDRSRCAGRPCSGGDGGLADAARIRAGRSRSSSRNKSGRGTSSSTSTRWRTERFVENTPDRCYFCKASVCQQLIAYAHEEGYAYVIDGSNADDTGDYRPGARAAREYGMRSPLQETRVHQGGDPPTGPRSGAAQLGQALVGVSGVAPALRHAHHRGEPHADRSPPKACCAAWACASIACAITGTWRASKCRRPTSTWLWRTARLSSKS